MEPRLVTLPSGAILKVQPAPFAAAKALYQAVLRELSGISISSGSDTIEGYKNLMCVGFSSPAIEACLKECFKRCTVDFGAGDIKITDDIFEPADRRGDYVDVCLEVATDNISPFGKSLFAKYRLILATLESVQK